MVTCTGTLRFVFTVQIKNIDLIHNTYRSKLAKFNVLPAPHVIRLSSEPGDRIKYEHKDQQNSRRHSHFVHQYTILKQLIRQTNKLHNTISTVF